MSLQVSSFLLSDRVGAERRRWLNVLAGLEKLQRGQVFIDSALPKAGRDDIAYMFARPALLPWKTVIENVAFGMEIKGIDFQERCDRSRELIRRVSLRGFETAYPAQLSRVCASAWPLLGLLL